jgi:hypothetical protein
MSARMRNGKTARWLAWLALAALLPRMLMPAGTMPQFGTELAIPLAFCTSTGLELRSSPLPPTTPDHGGSGGHTDRSCPFAALFASAVPAGLAAAPAFSAAFLTSAFFPPRRAAHHRFAAAHRARAPPHFD